MSNQLRVEAVSNTDDQGAPLPPVEVEVTVESAGERDIGATSDGIDLIQRIAAALHLSVSISNREGDADDAA